MFLLDEKTINDEFYETSWSKDYKRYRNICQQATAAHATGRALTLSKEDYAFVVAFERRMNQAAINMGVNSCNERMKHYLETKKMLRDAKITDEELEYGVFGNIATGYVGKDYPFANTSLDKYCSYGYIPRITKIVSNKPDSVVYFSDGTKSVVRCENSEAFDAEKGIYLAILKKAIGAKNLRHIFNLIEDKLENEKTNSNYETEYYSKEDWDGCDTEEDYCYD